MNNNQVSETEDLRTTFLAAAETIEPTTALDKQIQRLGEPEVGDKGEQRSRRSAPFWALTAAAALLIFAGSMALLGGRNVIRNSDNEASQPPSASSQSGEPVDDRGYFTLDQLPDGFKVIDVAEGSEERRGSVTEIMIFGSEGDEPFADGDLLLSAAAFGPPDRADAEAIGGRLEIVEVAGEKVYIESLPDGLREFMPDGYFVPLGDGGITASSRSLSRAEMLQLSETIVTQGIRAVDGKEFGLELLYEGPNDVRVKDILFAERKENNDSTIGLEVIFNQPEAWLELKQSRTAFIQSGLASGEIIEVDVAGKSALFSPGKDGGVGAFVSFSYDSEVDITVHFSDPMERSEAIRIAELVRPATSDEIREMRRLEFADVLGEDENGDPLPVGPGETVVVEDGSSEPPRLPTKAKPAPTTPPPLPTSDGDLEKASPEQIKQAVVQTLEGTPITFASGDTTLSDDSKKTVDSIAKLLLALPEGETITIVGYGDGGVDSESLGSQRAGVVFSRITLDRSTLLEAVDFEGSAGSSTSRIVVRFGP